ncbi:hypothetical protein GOODEAATRI_001585 [Goodea atripinnis]|uniref:EGF-like domain-containing protein n=1 Tax=Goodea atripinnis TaxID=208336 RepID=A0ABV0PK97_9TELE
MASSATVSQNYIDECLVETLGCEHYCVNTLGTYQCFCRVGFRLDQDQHSCICELQLYYGSFGNDCSVSCEDCVNGVCSKNRDRCDCSPGWTGTICNESLESPVD